MRAVSVCAKNRERWPICLLRHTGVWKEEAQELVKAADTGDLE